MKTYRQAISDSSLDIFDAKILLAHTLGVQSVGLYSDLVLTLEQQTHFEGLVSQRLSGKPVDLIIGSRGFYLGEFKVTEDVLSPRPDTECIIEGLLSHISQDANLSEQDTPLSIMDLGTGSGCIIISLLMVLKNASGLSVDISDRALEVAKFNAIHNGVDGRLKYLQSDWFENVTQTFDVIVSNPPYIPSADINDLQIEVKKYDPMLALDGGVDGLLPYYIIAKNAKKHLKPNGILALEFGVNQARLVESIFIEQGFKVEHCQYDLGGIERGLLLKSIY